MIASARVSFGVMFLAPAKCQGGDLNRCSKLHRYSITGATGNLRAVQLLLGHTKLKVRSGISALEVDDALAIAEQVEV